MSRFPLHVRFAEFRSASQRPAFATRRIKAMLRAGCFAVLLFLGGQACTIGAMPAIHPHKEHRSDFKREIEAVEEEWRTAQLAGDVATMDKLLADDYFGISMSGQLNDKTQQLERLKRRSLVLTRIDVSEVRIKLVGRVAIVTSLAKLEGTSEGTSMAGTYRYTRVYRRSADGSWKITNFEVTRVPQG